VQFETSNLKFDPGILYELARLVEGLVATTVRGGLRREFIDTGVAANYLMLSEVGGSSFRSSGILSPPLEVAFRLQPVMVIDD